MSSSTELTKFERLRSKKNRLIQSGYNKGTIRSDMRSLVVPMSVRRHRLVSIDYITAVTAEVASSSLVVPAIHSKRVERISMKPTRVQKGAFLHPLLHPFSSIRAVVRCAAIQDLTAFTRVRSDSSQKRIPARALPPEPHVLRARSLACKHPTWIVTRNVATVPASP